MKVIFNALLMLVAFNLNASTDDEKQLLESWGVKKNNEGMIIYQNLQSLPPAYWVSTPIPQVYNIDYSVLPVNFKPLIMYGQ